MSAPKTITYSGELLVKMKESGVASEELLSALRTKAEERLAMPLIAVTLQKLTANKESLHDYASTGIYWWPNPDTPNGLPYVQRDGIRNPETIEMMTHGTVASAVHDLSLAAFYFDEPKYAKKAEKMLYDWFINEETYMRPHSRFAQGIPGIVDGRPVGLIDFTGSPDIFDAVCLLEYLGWIDEKVAAGVRDWYVKFTDWMITSEMGIHEDCYSNNHSTWYDVQILGAAIFTDRPALVKRVCSTAYQRRLVQQICEDGSQPHELARTKALNYSLYNFRAFTLIINMATNNGYTEYVSEDKIRGKVIIKTALEFLYKHAKDIDNLPYKEIAPHTVPKSLNRMLLWADARFPGEKFAEMAAEFESENSIWKLRPLI